MCIRDRAKYLVDEKHCDPACKKNDGWTPLHLACLNGHLDVAKYLVDEKHCDPASKDKDCCTLLHSACQNGHLTVVKYLVDNSHCDHFIYKSKHNMTSPFSLALDKEHFDIVSFLIEKLCEGDAHSEIHLHLACIKGCLLYTSPSPRDATLSRMPSSA